MTTRADYVYTAILDDAEVLKALIRADRQAEILGKTLESVFKGSQDVFARTFSTLERVSKGGFATILQGAQDSQRGVHSLQEDLQTLINYIDEISKNPIRVNIPTEEETSERVSPKHKDRFQKLFAQELLRLDDKLEVLDRATKDFITLSNAAARTAEDFEAVIEKSGRLSEAQINHAKKIALVKNEIQELVDGLNKESDSYEKNLLRIAQLQSELERLEDTRQNLIHETRKQAEAEKAAADAQAATQARAAAQIVAAERAATKAQQEQARIQVANARLFIKNAASIGEVKNKMAELLAQTGPVTLSFDALNRELGENEEKVMKIIKSNKDLLALWQRMAAQNPEGSVTFSQANFPIGAAKEYGRKLENIGIRAGIAAGVVTSLISIGRELGRTLMQQLRGIAEETIRVTGQFDLLKVALTSVLDIKKVSDTERTFREIRNLSEGLGVDVSSMASAFIPLIDNFAQLESLSKAAVGLKQLSTITGKTASNAEIVRSIAEGTSGDLRSIRQIFELTIVETDKLREGIQRAGVNGFIEELNLLLEGRGINIDAFLNTVEGRTSQITEFFRSMLYELGKKPNEALLGFLAQVQKFLQDNREEIMSFASAVGDFASRVINFVGDVGLVILNGIDWDAWIDKIRLAGETLTVFEKFIRDIAGVKTTRLEVNLGDSFYRIRRVKDALDINDVNVNLEVTSAITSGIQGVAGGLQKTFKLSQTEAENLARKLEEIFTVANFDKAKLPQVIEELGKGTGIAQVAEKFKLTTSELLAIEELLRLDIPDAINQLTNMPVTVELDEKSFQFTNIKEALGLKDRQLNKEINLAIQEALTGNVSKIRELFKTSEQDAIKFQRSLVKIFETSGFDQKTIVGPLEALLTGDTLGQIEEKFDLTRNQVKALADLLVVEMPAARKEVQLLVSDLDPERWKPDTGNFVSQFLQPLLDAFFQANAFVIKLVENLEKLTGLNLGLDGLLKQFDAWTTYVKTALEEFSFGGLWINLQKLFVILTVFIHDMFANIFQGIVTTVRDGINLLITGINKIPNINIELLPPDWGDSWAAGIARVEQFDNLMKGVTERILAQEAALKQYRESFDDAIKPIPLGEIPDFPERAEPPELTKEQEDILKKRLEIEKKYIEKTLDLEISLQEKRIDIWQKYYDKLNEIERKHFDDIEDAYRKNARKEEDLEEKYRRKAEDDEQKSRDKRLEIEKEYLRKLEELRRRFQFDAQEAIRQNDAIAFLRLRRQLEYDKREARIRRDQQLEDLAETERRKRQERDKEKARDREDLQRDLERQLEDLRINLGRQMREAMLAREKELRDLAIDEQRKREELQRSYDRQLEEFQVFRLEKEEGFDAAIARELELIEQGNQNILNKENEFYKNRINAFKEFIQEYERQTQYFSRVQSRSAGVGDALRGTPERTERLREQAFHLAQVHRVLTSSLENRIRQADMSELLKIIAELRKLATNPNPPGGQRRFGGPIYPGMAYLVGENGPELITPKFAGMVTPLMDRNNFRLNLPSAPPSINRVTSFNNNFSLLDPSAMSPAQIVMIQNMITSALLQAAGRMV